ncbi:hypothetical protein LEP1GSC107_3134 [Leptospira interrogans serovar Grippotyphosa str. UI 12769]|uniref:Uncharacterized protein n=2 Tax=Leptospira interrogans TaxID=173 RepID=M6G2Q7_LEPIR|nr:hypothetical protein LEP1GSC027_2259 [Leptospira interrogans str. 2002000624]EKO98872.1 hypothetical protein LEP1GSC057_0651 [Leptospira interrogans str. Brem 329]EKP22391.1 hypothetical protein LEP1GSC117_4151 [Leptospira interrogans serovar Icterohaemorrhagiae str. Verdun LP]EKQ36505.1 hypothetical protein LEP1GSC025_1164 [Leptospira interrogans str. 2002000621]EKR45082.1 hypothetical protein LEP1GSC097_3530 [Leptospira interrogans serovar Grippotyphosa str. UI 08368]EMF44774.1 hypothetic
MSVFIVSSCCCHIKNYLSFKKGEGFRLFEILFLRIQSGEEIS